MTTTPDYSKSWLVRYKNLNEDAVKNIYSFLNPPAYPPYEFEYRKGDLYIGVAQYVGRWYTWCIARKIEGSCKKKEQESVLV